MSKKESRTCEPSKELVPQYPLKRYLAIVESSANNSSINKLARANIKM